MISLFSLHPSPAIALCQGNDKRLLAIVIFLLSLPSMGSYAVSCTIDTQWSFDPVTKLFASPTLFAIMINDY